MSLVRTVQNSFRAGLHVPLIICSPPSETGRMWMLVSPVMRLRVPVLTPYSRGGLGQNAMTFFEGSSKNGTDGQSSTVTGLSVSVDYEGERPRLFWLGSHARRPRARQRETTSALASAHSS
jgi:hypothetical protein